MGMETRFVYREPKFYKMIDGKLTEYNMWVNGTKRGGETLDEPLMF